MKIKPQIVRILILFGFILNVSYYATNLINSYSSEDQSSIVLEETDNSEKKEKESSEKEDYKEKDKISQHFDNRTAKFADLTIKSYPDLYTANPGVYLEHKTPPPKFS
ncbi:hypothetical protein M0D21_16790 [Aquimarina sp. D1M17]|uniref:hypothetical protein n=1 Tax=Aquimarina acroporae TaxID=2937283 RepID=UPI0020BEA927|nr:hypothetical protein [Aquimarina acroporae]MCK8523239.1 hypothetical protein [Aquimarina acroporae]